jgi:hypothetical protein
MEALLVAFMIIGIIALLVIYNGWALSVCWNWTMPELFDLPSLDLSAAIAIAALSGVVVSSGETGKERTNKETTNLLVTVALKPLVAIAVVWICMK